MVILLKITIYIYYSIFSTFFFPKYLLSFFVLHFFSKLSLSFSPFFIFYFIQIYILKSMEANYKILEKNEKLLNLLF